MYSLYRVAKKIGKRRWIYLLLALQLAVGTVLTLLPLEMYEDKMVEFRLFTEQLMGQAVGLLPHRGGEWDFVRTVTLEDYQTDSARYEKDLAFTYVRYVEAKHMWINEEGVFTPTDISLVFMDASTWNRFHLLQGGQGVIGSALSERWRALRSSKEMPLGTELSSGEYAKAHELEISGDESELVINGRQVPLVPMEDSLEQRMFSPTGSVEYGTKGQEIICLPLEVLEVLGEEQVMEQGTDTWATLTVEEKTPGTPAVWQWLDGLQQRHQGVHYELDSVYMQKKLTMSQILSDARAGLVKAVSLLVLVNISSAGIMYLVFLHRRRDVAIAMMVGSTRKRQAAEVLLEVYAVILGGTGAGLLYTLVTHGALWLRTWVTLGMMSLVMGAIIASLSLVGLFSLSPVEILVKE